MLNFRSLSLTTTDNKPNNIYSSVTDTRVLRLAEVECSLLVCESLLTLLIKVEFKNANNRKNNESAGWFIVGGINKAGEGRGYVHEHSMTECEYLHKYLHHKIRPGKQHWKDANTRTHRQTPNKTHQY